MRLALPMPLIHRTALVAFEGSGQHSRWLGTKPFADPLHHPQRSAPLPPLKLAQITRREADIVSELLLAESLLPPQPAHVGSENLLQPHGPCH